MLLKCVITGGPGVGKTTLVNKLREMGYFTIPEAARYVAEEEMRRGSGILPGVKEKVKEFQLKVLKTQIKFEEASPKEGIIFLDRGIVDGIAYFWFYNLEPPEELIIEAKRNRYDLIFFLKPLTNYKKDKVRWEDWKAARKIQKLIEKAYKFFGYEIIKVNNGNLEDRVKFVLNKVKEKLGEDFGKI
ncbi:hypothetical protein HRbin06_00525 [archaeon HR06]|nr:hypothetical protein HRbin06_00525 [archaeon HR06]